MKEIEVQAVIPREKGRVGIRFADGIEAELYRSELYKLSEQERELLLKEGSYVPLQLYQKVLTELLGLRVKKRAMFLLEQMNRTEQQLCEKLRKSGYPEVCVQAAVAYVKQYHYIDDEKYARAYVRYHQQKKSRQCLRMDLQRKGVARDLIDLALEEEFVSDEREKIQELLLKRRYDCSCADRREQQRMYQFLLRRGYKSGDILAVLRS